MKNIIVVMGGFLLFNIIAQENFGAYAHVDWGVNFITLHTKPFRQSPAYMAEFKYQQSVGFPTLSLDLGIISAKKFRFLRHDNNFICGAKIMVSNTTKKIWGALAFQDDTNPSRFLVRHNFNVAALSPYIGIVFNGEGTRFGVTGAVTWFNKMLERAQIYENNNYAPYTGIHLRPRDRGLGGTLRLFADKQYDNFFFGLSYEYTRGTQQYGRHIFIEKPDAPVSDFLQGIHLLQGVHELEIAEAPTVRFGIHTLSLSVGVRV